MSNSFFFLQANLNENNKAVIAAFESYANAYTQPIYIIDRPLADKKYSYDFSEGLVLLIPNYKIIFLNFSDNEDAFEEYYEDFIEDLGSISDKFRYKDFIGRPRFWRRELITKVQYKDDLLNVNAFLQPHILQDPSSKKKVKLLISLLTGSVNDIERVKGDVPQSTLEKVKQKIILFDGDQTRFVYQKLSKKVVTIQGLSGTGKTELLLHKLRELYVDQSDSKIFFTCHNKILADSLRRRIPEFFNFMKVEEQIKWYQRLWCVNAWGSQYNKDSGAYSYICNLYGLPFYRFSYRTSFDDVCKIANEQLKDINIQKTGYAFDFMLIDESQDFPSSFIELCEKVTKNTVYVAGDIFQSIFADTIISEVQPDFLLSKCYRTDPKTLMFAHALGMGLYETPKLNWLKDHEWKSCGYEIKKEGQQYELSREPLKRFDDIDDDSIQSIELVKTSRDKEEDAEIKIIEILKNIIEENPSVLPDDIGIIFIDSSKNTYESADKLELSIPRLFGWDVNKAYESKEKIDGTLFVSNKNNVKGLEFPFVICVTKKIVRVKSVRNALYMMLTRSFLKTYLLTSQDSNVGLIEKIESGLNTILSNNHIKVTAPDKEEEKLIRTKITYEKENISHFDFMQNIFDDIGVESSCRDELYAAIQKIAGESFEYERMRELAEMNYSFMEKK